MTMRMGDKEMTESKGSKNQTTKRAGNTNASEPGFFLLRPDPKYSFLSITNIEKAVGGAILIGFLLIIIVRIGRIEYRTIDDYEERVHSLRYFLLCGLAATLVLGVTGFAVSWINIRALTKRAMRISVCFLAAMVLFYALRSFMVRPFFYNVIYFVVLMSLPLFAVMIHAFRNLAIGGILISTAGVLMFSEFCLYNLEFAGTFAYLVLFLTCVIPLFILAIAKRFFKGSIAVNFAVFFLALGLGFSFMAMYRHDSLEDLRVDAEKRVTEFFVPDSAGPDNYETKSAAFIQKMNARSELLDSSREAEPDTYYSRKVVNIPENAFESFVLSYTAAKIGIIPAVILAVALVAVPVLLLISSLRRQNRFAMLLSSGCSLMLLSQTILYILGNLGYSFFLIPDLPFLPLNIPAYGTNLILVGLIVACHRGDGKEAVESR